MTTLPLRAPHVPHVSLLPLFARLRSYLSIVLESYVEALEQTHKVRRQYPFADV